MQKLHFLCIDGIFMRPIYMFCRAFTKMESLYSVSRYVVRILNVCNECRVLARKKLKGVADFEIKA